MKESVEVKIKRAVIRSFEHYDVLYDDKNDIFIFDNGHHLTMKEAIRSFKKSRLLHVIKALKGA